MTTTINPTSSSTPATVTVTGAAQHHAVVDTVRTTPTRILMVVANPATSTTLGGPVGFWAAELTHPWYAFTQTAGYDVTIASPDGGQVEFDTLSDPRDPSRWSADDIISMGFLHTPELLALLQHTPRLADLNPADYDALVVAGGQSPMWTFRGNTDLHRAIIAFYTAEKVVAVYCHGLAALVDCQLDDGNYLITGKTVTGFSNVEEAYSDKAVGRPVMPWRVENALRDRGANYISAGLFKPFAVRDGRLITGQQQYSGAPVAAQVIAALGT